jgi:hypothetical protein
MYRGKVRMGSLLLHNGCAPYAQECEPWLEVVVKGVRAGAMVDIVVRVYMLESTYAERTKAKPDEFMAMDLWRTSLVFILRRGKK